MKKQRISQYFFLFALLFLILLGGCFWKFSNSSARGLTLEQAQSYSSQNHLPVFLYRSSSKRYFPLTTPLLPHSNTSSIRTDQNVSMLFLDDAITFPDKNSHISLSSGDKLVYVSASEKAPETLSLSPITKSGNTLPILFESSDRSGSVTSLVTLAKYNPAYQNYTFRTFNDYNPDSAPASSVLSAPSDPITINGLSPEDYLSSVSVRQSLSAASYSGSALTQSMVDLTGDSAPVTIGYYSGTIYRTFQLKPDCRWLALDKSISCPTVLTQDGFAQIDLSALAAAPGYYALQLPDTTFYFLFELAA